MESKKIAVVTLNAKLQPMHRADLEDAFDEVSAEHRLGARVVGGGTALTKDGEVQNCDIEIELDDASPQRVENIVGVFGAMLAPKGSSIRVDGQEAQPFGNLEGLGLYLNGSDLPDEVYETGDINHVYAECERLLEGVGGIQSYWQGPTESALYMYGESYAVMLERIADFVAAYPLCQKCRIVQIA